MLICIVTYFFYLFFVNFFLLPLIFGKFTTMHSFYSFCFFVLLKILCTLQSGHLWPSSILEKCIHQLFIYYSIKFPPYSHLWTPLRRMLNLLIANSGFVNFSFILFMHLTFCDELWVTFSTPSSNSQTLHLNVTLSSV